MTFLNLSDIDKTILTAVLNEVISAGYNLDVSLYANEAAYTAALDTLRATIPEKELIYVYGVSSAKAKGVKTSAQVIINRQRDELGLIGGDVKITEQNLDGTFNSVRLPSNTVTLTYEIRVACEFVKYERIIFSCLSKALGMRKRIKCLSERTGTASLSFQIDKISEYDASSYDFIQKVYTYEVRDVFLEEYTSAPVIIQPLILPDISVTPVLSL